ncbi:unnamed protein product [Enterobius vermicularis]|uniref:TRAUB domain-containing protein n=1 Tax=Enterobius vermicularis TaxID=51028 RepID=A0A0N4UZ16_ENTVE|nr:unnamed protein product [Enterobius vermicularis]
MKPTKMSRKNFSAFDSVVLQQIDQIMADKKRLIRRTQVNRSGVDRIGGNLEVSVRSFYTYPILDLIEKKESDATDPIEMSRCRYQLRQRKSKKKKVDTKASKGRKIRYAVIPKLVNYYPSMPEKVKWSHEMRNQLFNSLFSSKTSS